MISGNNDVARKRHLEPATQSKTVDCGNQWFPDIRAISQTTESALRKWPGRKPFCRGILEIVASRKCFITTPGKNDHPHILVGNGIVPNSREFCRCWRMYSIHHCRTIHRNRCNMPLFLVNGVLVSHTVSFS